MVQQIPLGKERFALVDDVDFDRFKDTQWFLSRTGYAVGLIPQDGRFRLVYMHRLVIGAEPDALVDHINADTLDNRRSNLRLATPEQNGQNKQLNPLSKTQLKGVGWHKRRRKYHARIQLQGMRYHLGFFVDAETAALTYDAAARLLFGAYARCNYPDRKTPTAIRQRVMERLAKRGLKVG